MSEIIAYSGHEEEFQSISNKEAFDKANEIGRLGDYAISWQTEKEYKVIQEILNLTLMNTLTSMLLDKYQNTLEDMKEALGIEHRDYRYDAVFGSWMDFWKTGP